MEEKSLTDGKTYTVQYFERAVFEQHPELQPPNNVLLSLLGVFRYREKYPQGAPDQKPNTDVGSRLFAETGKRLGGLFLKYWNEHGGLAQQGLPISEEFMEKSDLDGKTYL
ncbi:MAG TPA: N-acetylmuramoyl-L-alanine amidase, partial [Chloroflexia bacterium]